MLSVNETLVIQWFEAHATLLAGLVTAAIALLLLCGVECCNCNAREKDELFKRRS